MTRQRYEVAAAWDGASPRPPAGPCPCSRRLCIALVLVLVLALVLAAALTAVFVSAALRRNVIFAPDVSKLYRGGENITEGDMLEEDTSDGQSRNAAKDRRRLWPLGRVPYTVDAAIGCPSSPRCEVLLSAIEQFNNGTCVRWEETTAAEHNAVQLLLRPNSGCYSHVGYRWDSAAPQVVILGNGCFNKGILLHLLGHTLGLWHEHNRPDRDNWLRVNLTAVPQRHLNSFRKFNVSQHHIVDRLDINSVMMHGSEAFSDGAGRTMTSHWAPESLPEVHHKTALSRHDLDRLQSMYIRQCSRRRQGT